MKTSNFARRDVVPVVVAVTALLAVGTLSSCPGSSVAASTTTNATATNAYALAYQKATYNNGTNGTVTVSFPSACSMTISSTGAPYQHQTYYLTPASNGATVYATTASGIQLTVSPYAGTGLSQYKTISATFNTCPTKASSTTTAAMGSIGFIFSGNVLFNPYEATGTVALGDNASYTFTMNGTSYTASFLDSCNQHTNQSSTWHYHGNPVCWTSTVDGTSNGPSHIIGIALDGFPIYGGRDVNGNVIDASTLDACNGITSATPEFPSGAYHYVLPIDSTGKALTTKQSSINCYAGTVSTTIASQMKALGCKMPMLLANGNARLPDGKEVSVAAAQAWMMQNISGMPGMMQMGTKGIVIPGVEAVKAKAPPRHHHAGMKMDGM